MIKCCFKNKKILDAWIAPVFALMMTTILLILLIFSKIDFACRRNYLSTFLLILFGTFFILGLFTSCKKIKFQNKNWIIVSITLFFLQIFAVYNYYFYTGWDVSSIIEATKGITHGEDVSWLYGYFSRYPNNLMLVWIFSVIEKFMHLFGVHEYEYFALLCFQCFLNTLTGFLLIKILEKIFINNKEFVALAYIIYALMIGMSPWVSIPYSDSLGLIFPIAIFYIYINFEENELLKWFCIVFLALIGYKIKPQIVIILIAIIFKEFVNRLKLGNFKYLCRITIGILCGIVLSSIVSHMAISSLGIVIEKEKTFGISHFFMMGLNSENMGVWSEEDVNFSDSYSTSEERNHANMIVVKERIKDMGLSGIAKQLVKKTLTNYNDGTFCWAGEGNFFSEVFEKEDNIFNVFFRGLYYTRDYSENGHLFILWSNFVQMLWVTILFFNIFAVKTPNDNINVLMLAIIGLTAFELVFEARARYLYIYAPIYIILGVYGFSCQRDSVCTS